MSARHHIFLPLILGLALVFQGCANYRVVVPQSDPTADGKATLHTYFWGATDPTFVADRCTDNVLDEVRVKNNLGYALISVLTLGIWMPIDVEYKCGALPTDPGEKDDGF